MNVSHIILEDDETLEFSSILYFEKDVFETQRLRYSVPGHCLFFTGLELD